MSRNILTQANSNKYPLVPKRDISWRSKAPVGSAVRLTEYKEEEGWRWKTYTVLKYFPYVVLCRDKLGFMRCFGNWEFQKRQKGRIDKRKGGGSHAGIEAKIGDG